MGSGGQQTSTQQNLQNPAVGYWTDQALSQAGPYYLGNLQMPSSLNQQTAGFTPAQLSALNSIIGQASGAGGLANVGSSFLQNMLATNPTAAIAQGGLAEQGILKSLGLGGTTGMLADTISGKYLDPSTNPWLRSTFNQAAQGVTDQYSLATAPSLMAEGEVASGGGPGAFAGNSAANQLQWANRYGLGQNLDNLATDIYGGNYQAERANQLAAVGQAAGLAGQGIGIGEAGVGQQLSALGQLPQTLSSLYTPAQETLGAGTLQQQQQQSVLNTLWQNAMRSAQWPQQMFSNFGSLLNQLGSGSGTQITTSPNAGAMK